MIKKYFNIEFDNMMFGVVFYILIMFIICRYLLWVICYFIFFKINE